jgi:hypothetical protein
VISMYALVMFSPLIRLLGFKSLSHRVTMLKLNLTERGGYVCYAYNSAHFFG